MLAKVPKGGGAPPTLVKGARTRVSAPRPTLKGRHADLIIVDDVIQTRQLPAEAVTFLGDVLPFPYREDVVAEDSRRRLGGPGRSVLADGGFILEFSRPFRRPVDWVLFYHVRVLRRPRLSDFEGLELIMQYTINGYLAQELRTASKELGIKVINARRGREADKESAGKFDHELGLSGRLKK